MVLKSTIHMWYQGDQAACSAGAVLNPGAAPERETMCSEEVGEPQAQRRGLARGDSFFACGTPAELRGAVSAMTRERRAKKYG